MVREGDRGREKGRNTRTVQCNTVSTVRHSKYGTYIEELLGFLSVSASHAYYDWLCYIFKKETE